MLAHWRVPTLFSTYARLTPLTTVTGLRLGVGDLLAGGNRIPKLGERRARSVAELRAAGVGVDRVLLLHDGSPASSDLFASVLTMLDDKVVLFSEGEAFQVKRVRNNPRVRVMPQ